MLGRRRALALTPAFLAGLLLGAWLGPGEDCGGGEGGGGGGAAAAASSAAVHPPPPPGRLGGGGGSTGRQLLLVGVMTADGYLRTRAAAVWSTWAPHIPGRVIFFTSEHSRTDSLPQGLHVVRLPGVDDAYPPQKKSFLMLEYIWERYGRSFEWFLRADDDVYIRPRKLEQFLRSIDSSKAFFIGQAGRGTQEEAGLLSLEYDENFCMGGPGVILSRTVLARVAPHLRSCLRNLYTTHEDVELGRCVQRYAGVSCTWSYEMQKILYHNSSGREAFAGNLKEVEVHRAITLHPVKQHRNMYRIHNYMQALQIQDLEQELLMLYRDILSMSQILGLATSDYIFDDIAQFGQAPGLSKFSPRLESELIPWDFVQRSLYSPWNSNPRRRVDGPLREGLDDVIREVMEKINMFSKQRGRMIDFKEVLYGYHRYNPIYGADYILDLLLVYRKYRGRKMTVPVRRHAYLQQQFTSISMREVFEGEEIAFDSQTPSASIEIQDSSKGLKGAFENGLIKIGENLPSILFPLSTEQAKEKRNIHNKMINFILPLSGRFETLKRFMRVFEEVCLKAVERVSLTVVLFPNEKEDSMSSSLGLIKSVQNKYPYAKVEGIQLNETFARAKALQIGAMHIDEPNDLLFFIDVDIVFKSGALQRIRMNTIRNKSVYFPIVFSEFDPNVVYNSSTSPDHFHIDENSGYWRQFGFGIGSVYKSDLLKVGGFDTSIIGWGKEDVDLFEKFVGASQNLTVFRSVDVDIVHVFHIVECDTKLDQHQMRMCKASRSDTYGSINQLTNYVQKNKDIVNKYLRGKG